MEELQYERGKLFILSRPSIWRERFELREGTRVIALMFYPKWYSDSVEINYTCGKSYEIFAKGLLRLKFHVREKGFENPIAEYESSFFGKENILTLPMGTKLKFFYKQFKDSVEIKSESGNPLVSIKRKSLFRTDYEIYIDNNSELIEKYPFAILFACYKLNQRRKRRT